MANKNVDAVNITIAQQMRGDWPAILMILASLVAGIMLYPYLPEQVPSHWNIRGEVDGYSSRFWGAFALPLLNAGIYLAMLVMPRIDPHRHNYVKFDKVYQVFKLVMVCFFTALYVVTVLAALGYNISVERLVPLGVSLLIIITGNLMGKIQHNYFVGIKLPWTLASEVVWRKTHRMAAPLWVVAGLIGVTGSVIGGKAAAVLLFGPLSVAVAVPVVYSYLLYRRLNN